MWLRMVPWTGTDVYHIVFCFVFYSIVGWVVESIYMSICNKKLTNRGFGFGPFCPIYGFGATFFYYVLVRFASSKVAVFFIASIGATIFEFLVGIAMIKFLGELWWDYNDKPFNYKGILCLESTIAWGVYGLGVVYWLHERVLLLGDYFESRNGRTICVVILVLYLVDFIYHLLKVLGLDFGRMIMSSYRKFRAKN